MNCEQNSTISYFFKRCIFFVILLSCTQGLDRQKYIVYMGHLKPTSDILPSLLHLNFFQKVLGSSTSATITHSYRNIINGFVAMLTNEEVKLISSRKEVVSVFPNSVNHMHTTNSWDFMGFNQTVKRAKMVESNIIIGIMDSGIWPESDSFDDTGFGPPPTKWKGTCEGLINFTCNNKIIGGRYYNSGVFKEDDIQSPRDTDGHGTHIASIVAGGVTWASFDGLANGTARGGVPSSRIAVYKVCWNKCCLDEDIIFAFIDAIMDGVDIISVSFGRPTFNSGTIHRDYFNHSTAIGSFHAMRAGIMTSVSGGNKGPREGTIGNSFPWALTVGSSTTNRSFVTNLILGNRSIFKGYTVNTFTRKGLIPIAYGGDVAKNKNLVSNASLCKENSINPERIKNKILICDQPIDSDKTALLAGAVGLVVRGAYSIVNTHDFILPATYIDAEDGKTVLNYIKRTRKATATIIKSIEITNKMAPYVQFQSSRGPNSLSYHILKPDLCAPGEHILAAWIPTISPTGKKLDNRRTQYNIQSGTSMASPHAAAAAAYVKSFNPSWSSTAIKSAMMTTAFEMSARRYGENEFDYGAGHINPIGAINPGLVYDANEKHYIEFLCNEGYDDYKLQLITGDNSTCRDNNDYATWNLNLPSISFRANSSKKFKVTFSRTVTNVGLTLSTYFATIIGTPPTLKIQVIPNKLSFSRVVKTQMFTLIVEGVLGRGVVSSSYLSWTDGTHKVRSPIVIYT